MSGLVPHLRRHRILVAVLFDSTAWVASYLAFAWLRLDGGLPGALWVEVAAVGVVSALIYLGVGASVRLHQGRAVTGSLDEYFLLSSAVLGVGAVMFLVNLVFEWIPRSIPVAATLGTLALACWARAVWRRVQERDTRLEAGGSGTPVLVIGAGEGGRELIASMLRDPTRTWRPVGLLDDDRAKRHRRLYRIPVLGTTERLVDLVAFTGAEAIVVAIPSAGPGVIARLRKAALEIGVDIKVLPPTTELLTHHVGIRDLRDINLNDVLGRNQLDTDVSAIAGYLTGRRVLVTGAGGSIGSELCRQISRFDPAELMMLDRDESALHAVQLSIEGRAMLDSDDVILCDIRDAFAVRHVFEARRPEVVFHAAALKHLPMLEQYPGEAVKTNVVGTLHILDACELVGVDKFVNISTDKAANPSSVLGYSKRLAERLTAARAEQAEGTYLSVRFGNVLGSRGSVLTAFAKQIASGGPVTVTHPDVTRFFMTIEEACQLVIQAAAIGSPGEALVLDMGAPVKIEDMARQLIARDGAPIAIEYTGLRPGEKLHEELFSDLEPQNVRPAHPMVSHVPVPPIHEDETNGLPQVGSSEHIRARMAALCSPQFERAVPGPLTSAGNSAS